MTATVTLVPYEVDVQMGVTCTLQGQPYWYTYLDELVADIEIDEQTRYEWEVLYDGYEMVWEFSDPTVVVAEQNIDAACIFKGF